MAGRMPAFPAQNAGRMPRGGNQLIDPQKRWLQYGEKPDYVGLLTFAGMPYTEDAAELAGKEPDAEIAIALGRGKAQAHVFFSDLGHEYIRVNAEYRT